MDVLDAIFTRRSIRAYTQQHISDEDLQTILRAGMSGPSCANRRDWAFLAVRDRALLERMAEANGRPAEVLGRSDVGILILGDLERAFQPAPDYWVIDGAIAGQNMVLAAQGLGIGSVWLGTWPQMDRVERQRALLGLPEHMIPHSILAFGYPAAEQPARPGKPGEKQLSPGAFEPERVHYDKW